MLEQNTYPPSNLQAQPQFQVQAKPKRRERAELMLIPLVIFGLVVAFYGFYKAPWQADYENSREFNTATHWERLQGNDIPKDMEGKPIDVKRTEGYEMRRVVDVTMYVGIVFSILCVLALGIINRGWVYIPIMAVGLLGVLYAGTAGVMMGPLITGAGFALVLFGSSLGWFASQRISAEQE